MTRYYGYYSNKYKSMLDNIYELYGIKKKRHIRTLKERKVIYERKINELKYRSHMIKSYSKDPLLCRCGELMIYSYSYNPFEGGTINDRQYRQKSIHELRRLHSNSRRTTRT